MKKAILIIACSLFWFGVQAQKKKSKDNPTWFNLELKGGGGISLLANSNIWGDDKISYFHFKFQPAYGIGLGSHIVKGLAVQFEKSWSTFGQKFSYNNNLPDQNYEFKSNEWAFYVRSTGESDNGGFVGLGYRASSISGTDSISKFRKNLSFIQLEFGGPVWQNNMLDINLNMRIGYCINDMVTAKDYHPGAYTTYPKYTGTHPITAQLLVGLNWHIGYWATSNCKHKGFNFFGPNS
ncbi:MAG: hypothetical protein HY951_13575 [Bacteroidia bacterium]|nr:hypothetical protein [Bacteroidia bacterium]